MKQTGSARCESISSVTEELENGEETGGIGGAGSGATRKRGRRAVAGGRDFMGVKGGNVG